jgi:hypothetical protein
MYLSGSDGYFSFREVNSSLRHGVAAGARTCRSVRLDDEFAVDLARGQHVDGIEPDPSGTVFR